MSANPPPVLETARLRIRPYRFEDQADVFVLFSDPVITRYWSNEAWSTIEQAKAYLHERMNTEPPSVYSWAIAEKQSNALIGTLSLFSLNGPQARAEVGYSLQTAFQGRGLAIEAVRAAIHYAFDVLKLERIEADIDPRNTSSCRLVEKLGFKKEGLLRNRWRVNGEVADSIFYGLLKDEYIRE
jgi:[ribosomal protein S5]-alanine N-acetyltransferase